VFRRITQKNGWLATGRNVASPGYYSVTNISPPTPPKKINPSQPLHTKKNVDIFSLENFKTSLTFVMEDLISEITQIQLFSHLRNSIICIVLKKIYTLERLNFQDFHHKRTFYR